MSQLKAQKMNGPFLFPKPTVVWKTNKYRALHTGDFHYDEPGKYDEQRDPIIVFEKFMGKDAFGVEAWVTLFEGDHQDAIMELTRVYMLDLKR